MVINLTEEEIRTIYQRALLSSETAKAYDSRQYHTGQVDLLEELFGEEFFSSYVNKR